ncbi:MAG: hypothetical protein ACRDY2_02645 [Acidimicrobiales bacterium]
MTQPALTFDVRYLMQIDLAIGGLYEGVGSHAKAEGNRPGRAAPQRHRRRVVAPTEPSPGGRPVKPV